jgi:calcium-dependent protein kinase
LTFKDQAGWKEIGDDAKDLISKLLVKDPKLRPTATQALDHPFLAELGRPRLKRSTSVDLNVIKKLLEHKGTSQLKTAAANLLIKNIEPSEFINFKITFDALDKNNAGVIEVHELEKVLVEKGLPAKDVADAIKACNVHGNSAVNYTEFLAATVDIH